MTDWQDISTAPRDLDKNPVLGAIRAILKFRDSASVAEIAKYCGMKDRYVLDVLNANSTFVGRNRKTGRVTAVSPKAALRKQLRESGAYYFPDTYGAWSVEGKCLRFEGHDDIRKQISARVVVGSFGDSRNESHVIDTPENREILEAGGLRLWSESEVDDRLWTEPLPAPPTPKGGA